MKPIILVLALATAVPALAGERATSEAMPAFDDLYYARQDAAAKPTASPRLRRAGAIGFQEFLQRAGLTRGQA